MPVFQSPPNPDNVQMVNIQLIDTFDDGGNPIKRCHYQIDLTNEGYPVGRIIGDLEPFLTAQQVADLQAIMDAVRAKAETDLLPAP